MDSSKGKMGVIAARCTIISKSAEASSNADAQKLAADLLKDIASDKDINLSVKFKYEESLTTKKDVKKWQALTVNSSVNSLLMLESLKPATEANPRALATKTNFSEKKLPALLKEAKVIDSVLKEKTSELLAHGYKQEQIDELGINIQKLVQTSDKVNAIVVELGLLRGKRKAMETEIDGKFRMLNSMVMVNKGLMPTLYNEYFSVKQIRNHNSHMTIEGSITCNGQPLANASITIISTVEAKKKAPRKVAADGSTVPTEKVIVSKLSNIKGEFSTTKLKSGTYKAIISKNGHTSQEVTLFVNPKETTKISVSLDKLEVFNN